MKPSTVFRGVWLLGGLALLLGWTREPLLGLMPRPRELPRADGATGKPWMIGGFVRVGDMQEIATGRLPNNIHSASSWLGGDDWIGKAESAWFRAARTFVHVGVAGYPQGHGCKLWVEFRADDGTITRIDCPLINPREEWNVWEIRRPTSASAVRVVAEDQSNGHAGWVAFSHPFRAWPGAVTATFLFAQLTATLALSLTLLWGPGLLWIARRRPAPEFQIVALLGAGALTLAVGGILIWCLSGWMRPQVLGLVLVGGMWTYLGAHAHRIGFALEISRPLRVTLGVTALVVVAVIAKSSYSIGPQGELFQGTISRNMAMGDRIDSRFSFYVTQAVAHHNGPASPITEKFYAPWTFFSRGPLAGLIATPLVLATNGHPPTTLPESRWSPYDTTGFAAYRIAMVVLASGVIVALFLTLVPLTGEKWAVIGAGLLALSPFGVHEILFTWPKWPATAWLLGSFALAHARRPLAAGLALGVGFFFHPLALLWSPWIALWAAGRSGKTFTAWFRTLVRFGLGSAALAVPWIVLGAIAPHLPTTPLAGQTGFLRYFTKADWKEATWDTWWSTRWLNFANTFVPLHLYLSHSYNHPKLSSAYETSGPLIRFSMLWWNTLPFAMGLALWVTSLVALLRSLRSLLAPILLFVAAPALLIIAYWGIEPLGLMRECGHPLFVAAIALTTISAAGHKGWVECVLSYRGLPWLQLPETWLMLWLTVFANRAPWAVEFAHLDPCYFAINALALLAAAWVLSRERASLASAVAPAETTATLRPQFL